MRQLDRDSLLVTLNGAEFETARVRGELAAWWTAWKWFWRAMVGLC